MECGEHIVVIVMRVWWAYCGVVGILHIVVMSVVGILLL